MTFLFDAPLAIARDRLDKNTAAPDKFEREQNEFFANVRAAYLRRAAQFPARIKIIDSARSLGEIEADLDAHLASLAAQGVTSA